MTTRPTISDVLAEPAGGRLDAWVAEYVCGIRVLGEAWCWAPDGDWSVLPAKLQEGHRDSGWVLRPVYDRFGGGSDPDGDNLFGVPTHALGPVGEYSTDWAAAGPLLDRLREAWGCVTLVAGLAWHCYPDGSRCGREWATGDTGPLAICRAALVHALERTDGR